MERRLDEVERLHLDREGPVEAVWQWVIALHRGDYSTWWRLMSFDWRSRLAQDWVGRYEDEIWTTGVSRLVGRYRACWPHGFKGWGAASHPRLVALDHEQVLLVDQRVVARNRRRQHDTEGRIIVPKGSGQLFDLTYAEGRWWIEEPVIARVA